jgi:hypothetical protein
MPTSSIARPSKIYTNCGFWFENMPSGNPDTYILALIFYAFSHPILFEPSKRLICLRFRKFFLMFYEQFR